MNATKSRFRFVPLAVGLGMSSTLSPLAFAANDYTRCVVPETSYQADVAEFCIPAASTSGRLAFTVAPADSSLEGAPVVLSIPAKNCRTPTGNIQGDLVLLVDSSQSLEKTDPSDERLKGVSSFLSDFQSRSTTGTEPRVGIVNYGGRIRVVSPDPARPGKLQYNQATVDSRGRPLAQSLAYQEVECANGDNAAELERVFNFGGSRTGFAALFPSADATARWNERTSSAETYPLSICEYLGLIGTRSGNGYDRSQSFVQLPAENPRGLTDVAYMLSSTNRVGLLGSSSARSRHVVIISDGLPVVRERRPKSYCLEKDHLPKSGFEIDDEAPVAGEEYCWDRNFRDGVNAAHATALSDFQLTNLHHILFWSVQNEVFIDFDDEGTLNPADFLIENSARTGNGKVKFDAATSADALAAALSPIIDEMDGASLQRVDITVTNQSGTVNPKYSAVSPLGAAVNPSDAADKRFDLKILYLKPGINSVRVEYIYGDSTVTEDFSVNVLQPSGSSSGLECGGASSSFTVDGDRKDYPVCLKRDARDVVPEPPSECTVASPPSQCDCRAPQGDGFLPFPDANGNIRIYRNADPANRDFESQDQFAQVEDFGPDESALKAADLRIQGGTGNCGVIAGLNNPGEVRKASWASLVILMIPCLALGLISRRRRHREYVKGGRQ